ncbi:FecR family protein [Mucilaginibacter sp. SG564]|uniref:FecR family protein n=1 Tax=Mucilaginibacter sp. SG564 TaxID=2587022 RepID=UPI0015540FBD|nr:FecR family protein [Mucilaginibacter sp. SG564]NOW96014.1 ferric-dicitrate binding protein FerR (iron transport regulator) [Mucilaginibacter sp. SG564]
MQDKNAREIIERYVAGTASEEEKALVEHWYLNSPDAETNISEESIAISKKQVYDALPIHDHPVKRPVSLWPRLAAAASIVMALGAGAYYLVSYQHKPGVSPGLINPYSAAAVLKSGGRDILLDKTANGKISATSITKAAGEEIIYERSNQNSHAVYDTIQIPAGGRPYTVKLTDGSRITLNAATTLRYPEEFSNDRSEEVELITGEIYAEVVHRKSAPLKIRTPRQVVTDLGTVFNIASYPDEPDSRTTLITGAVKVSVNGREKLLSPGEQAIVSGNDFSTETANLNEVTAWKHGVFRFNSARIDVIMRELSRWYGIEVKYEGSITEEVFYGRLSRNMSINEVLRVLQRSNKVSFKIEGRRVTVLSKS